MLFVAVPYVYSKGSASLPDLACMLQYGKYNVFNNTLNLMCCTHTCRHDAGVFIVTCIFSYSLQSDPNLRPVNVMECRNVLPTTPIVPPPAVLPANMSRFNPNHKVFCCTMNAVPATSGVLSKLKLPFAVHIHPYKDMPHNVSLCLHANSIVCARACVSFYYMYIFS